MERGDDGLHGPRATLNLNGSSPLVGSVMVKNLNLPGSATIHYTDALQIPIAGTGGSGNSGGGGGGLIVATVG